MADVPHLLYMFEFVVDDVVFSRKNHCAPDGYPTCVELTFRSNVYVSICDREYGGCMEPRQPQCGKCCIFALETPITKEDRLLIHVYKKRSNRCKFLMGLGEMKVKSLFEDVDYDFDEDNRDWLNAIQQDFENYPRLRGTSRKLLDTCECFDVGFERKEQFCPAEMTVKRMLPLFNLCKQQTGNIVLITRLICHGPSLVSAFKQVGNKNVAVPFPPAQHPCYIRPEEREYVYPTKGYRYFACNVDKLCPCDICEDEFDRDCPTVPCKRNCKRIVKYRKSASCCEGIYPIQRFLSYEDLPSKRPKCKKAKKKNA